MDDGALVGSDEGIKDCLAFECWHIADIVFACTTTLGCGGTGVEARLCPNGGMTLWRACTIPDKKT
jgi:hypothetical protein